MGVSNGLAAVPRGSKETLKQFSPVMAWERRSSFAGSARFKRARAMGAYKDSHRTD